MASQSIEFGFKPPPEAPVFLPSAEEFKDALAYITKIRPVAEKYGICKIKPPAEWQPPFAIDVDSFRFTPRIQRLNELEALTRVKLNFLDQIARFWELQGSTLKIPVVEKKALDLYTLHKLVQKEGGMEVISKERKWSAIGHKMGYVTSRCLGSVLKHHYERILYPYDIFKSGKHIPKHVKLDDTPTSSPTKKEKDYTPHRIPSRMAVKPPAQSKPQRRSRISAKDMLEKYVCQHCSRGDSEASMLLCDGCDDSYHTFCLVPPLSEIPKGDWRCPKCLEEEVSKPTEAFGFEQAQKEYTLQSFGQMADQFKADFFRLPVHVVPSEFIEKEYWRLVSSIDEDVVVEYGADLHTMDMGSGFPTKNSRNLAEEDMQYVKSGWNLNNMPVLDGSVLSCIDADISGMKVPWMYVGMCFSTFCWHNEDHWSYSINYLHWGEPKTWYGVPGGEAELFEESVKKLAPELFTNQPDLLHQLVTQVNPNNLIDKGVPIFRTDQQAGEFVITFPRSYHSGFNQGYNFAEAVNFCLPEWLEWGRNSIEHYSSVRRYCVFSHDELVCNMSAKANDLDLSVASACLKDIKRMIETETDLRKSLEEWGVKDCEFVQFELLPDDERQCDVCKTTCYLSAVACSCDPCKLTCLKHFKSLCQCPSNNHRLKYRYKLDEFPEMMEKVEKRAKSFAVWTQKYLDLCQKKIPKFSLLEFTSLVDEIKAKKFPETEDVQNCRQQLLQVEKCAKVFKQLATLVSNVPSEQQFKTKLTLEELKIFYEQASLLPCHYGDNEQSVLALIAKGNEIQERANQLLSISGSCDAKFPATSEIDQCIKDVESFDIVVEDLSRLKELGKQAAWLEYRADILHLNMDKDDEASAPLVTLEDLSNLLDKSTDLPGHPAIEKAIDELQKLVLDAEEYETRAREVMKTRDLGYYAVAPFIRIIKKFPVRLPAMKNLCEYGDETSNWFKTLGKMQSQEMPPYASDVEKLIGEAGSIPFVLEPLVGLEAQVAAAQGWRDKASKIFRRKNAVYSLIEVLTPRSEHSFGPFRYKKRKLRDSDYGAGGHIFPLTEEVASNPLSLAIAFKNLQDKEVSMIRVLRAENNKRRIEDVRHKKSDLKICVCRKAPCGMVMQCDLCKDWFHYDCLPPKKSNGQMIERIRFLCPCCERSKRPRLESVLFLLIALQKLPVRLPDGEALQMLAERAMEWQDKARNLLSQPEIVEFMAQAGNQANPGCENPLDFEDLPIVPKIEPGTEPSFGRGSLPLSPKKERKSSHIPRSKSSPRLNTTTESTITELLIEGELLEVSLEETQTMWKLLHTLKPQEPREYYIDETRMTFSPSPPPATRIPQKRHRGESSPVKEPLPGRITPKTNQLKPSTSSPNLSSVKRKRGPSGGMKRKPQARATPKKAKSGTNISKTVDDSDTDSYDEKCSAVRCTLPAGKEVHWVQCDGGCELWFHLKCVGLKPSDVSEDKDYVCINCS
ncbi:lysine-specific demethylase 5D-like isoform X2 [Artemia franciscana]|uniref:lysine-specific demethylase 5D-like isoform X2 n=1 Tax=Artemia franciscana TaxID=6661 RepID=UPI0032DBA47B